LKVVGAARVHRGAIIGGQSSDVELQGGPDFVQGASLFGRGVFVFA
jgi:hypothetical protein